MNEMLLESSVENTCNELLASTTAPEEVLGTKIEPMHARVNNRTDDRVFMLTPFSEVDRINLDDKPMCNGTKPSQFKSTAVVHL